MGNDVGVGFPIIGLEDKIGMIQSIIDNFEKGKRTNIAIIAENFAGKTTLINEIHNLNEDKVELTSFSSFVKDETKLQPSGKQKNIKIFDNCHLLYMHKIGGSTLSNIS
jgi:predicted ATPase